MIESFSAFNFIGFRATRGVLLLVGALSGLLSFSDAQAAEESLIRPVDSRRRTLEERIPAVTRRSFSKVGRVELSPSLGLSLNDPFYKNISGGGAVNFYLLESLAVGVSGEFYFGAETPIQVSGGGNPESPDFNRPEYAARLDVSWAPLYGKVSLLAERVLHFDTYLALGAGVIGPSESSATFAGSVALGQHYVLNEWFALKIEVRDQIYRLARNPAADNEKVVQQLLTVAVGLCFYLPTEVERTAL